MREKLEDAYLAWEVNVADELGSAYWSWKNKFMEKFVEDEEGDATMVAVVVLIVIVLAAAVVFKDALIPAVEKIMKRFTDFIGE